MSKKVFSINFVDSDYCSYYEISKLKNRVDEK